MNGVEILSSAEVASEFAFNWTAFWTTLGILFGIGLISSVVSFLFMEEWGAAFASLFVACFLGIWLGTVIANNNKIPISYETHYKVTIDDTVSMNEFLDKYEILDQEGKIYTVKERE